MIPTWWDLGRETDHTQAPQNGIIRSFLNYTLRKPVGEKSIQVLAEDCMPRKPRGYVGRPLAQVPRLFCLLYQIYGHSTQVCNRLAEEINREV